MDLSKLQRVDAHSWQLPATGRMRVPGVIYADRQLLEAMDDKVLEQLGNVAMLPGIVRAAYAMPDAHWGYGFPIGGVAAFDPEAGGIVSAGGVGFDISCGVRTLRTGLRRADIERVKTALADGLFAAVPVGVGSRGKIHLDDTGMDRMLAGGARWAVEQGYGHSSDLAHIEEGGAIAGADPRCVSARAKHRMRDELGTLGSGNHYLEVQIVSEIFDPDLARAYGLALDDALLTIHCGSRGLGHQIGTEFLREMATTAKEHGIELPDRELACAPLGSKVGKAYLGAMRAGMNCALANRQIITYLARQVFAQLLARTQLELLYDVSHNICKEEWHKVQGQQRRLFVHRKGATRAFPPGHEQVPRAYREAGQPVLIGGSMGTGSYILAGVPGSEQRSFSSACHGAGRAMSRHAARRRWRGAEVLRELAGRGIEIRSPSMRGVAEEAPDSYKDVSRVVELTEAAGLARRVARVSPIICVKG